LQQFGQYAGSQYAGEPADTTQCFSGDMVVQTPTGMKAMRDLQVGDNVLAIFDQTVENNLLELQNHLCDIKTDLPPRKRHKFANIS
jgi:hypothetical protein